MKPADLAALFTAQNPGLRLESGVVVTWDAASGYVIKAHGVELADVPGLASVEAVRALAPGDVVAVLHQRSSYLIIGRIVTPGT